MNVKRKVYVYITRGRQLLVMEHRDTPEAGVQVPGGSLEDGEEPAAGALREAYEETGLPDGSLRLVDFVGQQLMDWRLYHADRVDHRYFYHLECLIDTPPRWESAEHTPSDGTPGPVALVLYWVDLAAPPALTADQDHHLGTLRARLGL